MRFFLSLTFFNLQNKLNYYLFYRAVELITWEKAWHLMQWLIEGALNKRRARQPTPLFLPGEQWMEEASGL